MKGLSYERLEQITKVEKPYRGTTDRYPVGNRRHNLKNFFVREEDGVKVFDVTYGTRFKSYPLTKDEYEAMKLVSADKVHQYDYGDRIEYIRYEVLPFRIGTVYPAGYFQFNGDSYYGQGDRAFLSDCSNGWFANDSRRGGMVWTFGRKAGYRCVPIFKGMRISTTNADNFEVLDDYVVVGKKVNRKVGKDLLGGYETFYKTAETMCKAMSRELFLGTAKEIIEEEQRDYKKFFEEAEARRDQAPLDAMILYALSMGVGKIDQQIRQPSWYQCEPHEIFCNLKRKMNNGLYREHPEVFTPVHYGKGEAYPPSIWGYEVMVNGEVQQQY
jgi:aspartate 1-decarboxylase